MQSNNIRANLFVMSLSTSSLLVILGIILLLLQFSGWVTLFALVIFVVGIVQVIVDFGWISMIKMNSNLSSWRKAYHTVAQQRTQKIFIVPFLFDILFIILSLSLFLTFGMKL